MWDSEKELVEHYKKQNNYLKLQKGEVGGNLIYKYKSKSLVETGLDWIKFFEQEIFKVVKEKQSNIISTDVIKLEISEIAKFCRLKIHALLNPKINTKPLEDEFELDILKWLDDEKISEKRLYEYKFSSNEGNLIFEYTEEQIKVRNDVFKRYGTDINALSKIVTRISNLESQFRKLNTEDGSDLRDIYKKTGESFTKYALSN